MKQLEAYISEICTEIEQALISSMAKLDAPPSLREAMEYSLFAGGKRIRPVLLLATIEALGKERERGMGAACALEMIHTYSLIHDDLPAMDDDDYRRSKPTNHKVFGEAMAILAGDALLTHAFQMLSRSENHSSVSSATLLKMIHELALRSGANGMVGGQVSDMEAESTPVSFEALTAIHKRKTADLLIAAVRIGAFLGHASEIQMHHLTEYAHHIGIGFQIQDDILDVTGDEQKLGKRTGRDDANNKSTYISLLGLEKAQKERNKHVQAAERALAAAHVHGNYLQMLAQYMIQRER